MKKTFLTWSAVADRFVYAMTLGQSVLAGPPVRVYGVPRGGMMVAATLGAMPELLPDKVRFIFVHDVNIADFIVDDIIDSGRTQKKYQELFPDKPFIAIVNKFEPKDADLGWVVFPWETEDVAENRDGLNTVTRILELIGEDPRREGLIETPARVVKAWGEQFGGYAKDPADVFKTFSDGACDEMVLLKDVEFVSFCEHHMFPFQGKAHIAYIPNGKVIGVSKLARLLDIFASRLQIQERLCQQVTGALVEFLQPKGAACLLEARHSCMTARGVRKQNSIMVTSSLTGVFKTDAAARAEFMSMVKG